MSKFLIEMVSGLFLIIGFVLTISGFTQAEATGVGQYFTDRYFYIGLAGLVLVTAGIFLTLILETPQ